MRRHALARVAVATVAALVASGAPSVAEATTTMGMPAAATTGGVRAGKAATAAGIAGVVADCTTWWDGGAGTSSWHDARNWSDDAVPGAGDVVCIPSGETVVYSSGTSSIAGAEADGKLYVGGGSLGIEGEAVFRTLSVEGGSLTGAGNITVTESLSWNGGELAGSGTLEIAAGASGGIAEASAKTLARHVRNMGSLTWSQGTMVTRTDGGRHPHLDNHGTVTITGAVTTDWVSGSEVPLFTNRPGASIVNVLVSLGVALADATAAVIAFLGG